MGEKKYWAAYIFLLCSLLSKETGIVSGMPLHIHYFRWICLLQVFYFPVIGLLGIIALFLSNIKLHNNLKPLAPIILVIIVIIFSLRTIIRNNDWKNALTLALTDNYYSEVLTSVGFPD